jgi:glucuronokinase
VVAALRVMDEFMGMDQGPFELAEEALAVEAEELGLLAGPQDRVIQVYGGLLSMHFQHPRAAVRYEHLDMSLLPRLLVAWDPSPGENSGNAHQIVFDRWQAGDVSTRAGMSAIADLALEGRRALEQGDEALLGQLINRNFDHRRELFDLGSAAAAPVELARREGAAAKFCGSGGAVVVLVKDELQLTRLEEAYDAFGWRSIRPRVAPALAH